MKRYHKIQTVFKRDPATKHKTLLEGQYSMPEFEYLRNNMWVFTEKIDGTNIRVIYDNKDITIKGKSDKAQIPVFLYDALQEIFTMEKMEKVFGVHLYAARVVQEQILEGGVNVTLYGEGYGNRIQSLGSSYRSDNGFVLFDIRIGEWWLQRKDVEEIAKQLELEIAPIVGVGNLALMVEMARGGFPSQWGDFIAEGIVARPNVELKARNGNRIITKIKYKDFQRG